MLCPVLAFAGGAKVRIGTYNLRMAGLDRKSQENNWTAREPRLVQSFLKNQFDICGLQEVDSDEQRRIPQLLEQAGMNYGSYFFSPYSQDGNGPKGQGIIWRKDRFLAGESHFFWTSDPPEKMQENDFWRKAKFRRGGFCITFTDLENRGARYFVIVTHAPLSKEDHARNAHVYEDIERRYNPEGLPSFFLGDMNARESDEASAIYRNYWRDTYRFFNGKPSRRHGPELTFNGWNLNLDFSSDQRIDYIYFRGKEVKPLRYECDTTRYGGLYPSDHFPVFADFRIKAPKRQNPQKLLGK